MSNNSLLVTITIVTILLVAACCLSIRCGLSGISWGRRPCRPASKSRSATGDLILEIDDIDDYALQAVLMRTNPFACSRVGSNLVRLPADELLLALKKIASTQMHSYASPLLRLRDVVEAEAHRDSNADVVLATTEGVARWIETRARSAERELDELRID